jgi:hypothetical protein
MKPAQRAVLMMVTGTIMMSQPVLAATPSQLNSDVDSIMRLVRANKDGSNNQTIDDKINSLSLDEKIALIEPLHLKVREAQVQLTQMEKHLNQTNEPTLEVLRDVRELSGVLAVTWIGVGALMHTIDLSFTFMRAKIYANWANTPEWENRLSQYDLEYIKSVSSVKDGKLVPSFSKILKNKVNTVLTAKIFTEDPIGLQKMYGVVTIASTAIALGSQAAIAMLPESVGDKDLLKNRDSLRKNLSTLHSLMDSLEVHLDVLSAKFKMGQAR